MVADLTGLDIANASLLDEGTAAAEAMALARRSSRSKSQVFFASTHCHPQTLELLRTPTDGPGIQVAVGHEAPGLPDCFPGLPPSTPSLARLAAPPPPTQPPHP